MFRRFFGSCALGFCALVAATGCTSGESGTGSNTNWLTCESDPDCPSGNLCFEGACEVLDAEPCAGAAQIAIENVAPPLKAREGSYFAGTLYIPVEGVPAETEQNIAAAAIVARVRDASGAPLQGCSVKWLTSTDGGWVFVESETTSAMGTAIASWVAGSAPSEELIAAVVDDAGTVSSAHIVGDVLPHDAEPLSDGGPTTTAATSVGVSASLNEAADAVRVRALPLAAPHHSFFVASALPGFFTGLQNTSDDDAFAVDVPPEERLLLASVWNTETDLALLLWNAPEAVCTEHAQDLGGQKCELPDAWQPGEALTITVEARALAQGEAAPTEYADLGYLTTACESAAGCLDYTVFANKDGEAPKRVVAYRHPKAGVLGWSSSYIDAYSSAEAQTSCLLVPKYEVEFSIEERVAGEFAKISRVNGNASYSAGNNAVCANHSVAGVGGGFLLSTGGSELSAARPQRPSEPDRELVATP